MTVLSGSEVMVLIGIMATGTMLTRFLPFLLFPAKRITPAFVKYLGRTLPPAVIGLLVIYCLQDVSLVQSPHGLPELTAIGVIIILQRWKKNALLSMGVGTLVFMLLMYLTA